MGWFKRIFGFGPDDEEAKAMAKSIAEKNVEIAIREMAYEICVMRIAKAISKCEFRTYQRGKEIRSDFYYLLNLQPNPNQNATEFWEAFIHKLYNDMEVLIVPRMNAKNEMELYLADSFSKNDKAAFFENTFSKIQIKELILNRTYLASEVYYFQLQDGEVKKLLNETLSMYSDLLVTAVKSYKRSNSSKWLFGIDRQREANASEIKSILDEDMDTFLNDDNTVMPVYEGYTVTKADTGGTVQNTRDLKALIDDQLEITCKAFLIPTHIMTGEVTDTSKAVDDFLTFCLDSLVELISDELNRKTFKRKDYFDGCHIWINTQTIKHVDILDMANSIDKLIASGVKSINDILRILGEPGLTEDWADKHYITKNYIGVDEAANPITPDDDVGGKEEKG